MEDVATPEPRPGLTRTIAWVLSSSLVAATLALFATLAGLLYRMGWLSAFDVSADLFMPASATELTYWGYVAALEVWGYMQTKLMSATRTVLLVAAIYSIGTLLIIVSASRFKDHAERMRVRTKQLMRRTGIQASLAATIVFVSIASMPLLFISATALVVSLPLIGYSAGQRTATKSIKDYQADLRKGDARCNELWNASGPIGKCPMVIAQASGKIAYLDGDLVHVIPADGITVKWKLHSGAATAPKSKDAKAP